MKMSNIRSGFVQNDQPLLYSGIGRLIPFPGSAIAIGG